MMFAPSSLLKSVVMFGALTLAPGAPISSHALADTIAYLETNLVSDVPGLAHHTDPLLQNPWGMAFSVTSPFWISDQQANLATLYSDAGVINPLVVSTPSGPTGSVFNSTSTSFVITDGVHSGPAIFLFATLSGQIAGWNPAVGNSLGPNGVSTVTVTGFTAPDGAIYTGLARATTISGANLLYAADFRNGKIDVFDSAFAKMALPPGAFTDPNLPTGYAPYNVQQLNGKIYVLYAKVDPATGKAVPGLGSGFVDVFNLDGSPGLPNGLIRLISRGNLNAPWGIALAPLGFGPFSGALLVGNHGDGTISAFDPNTGSFLGQLLDPFGNPITIDGLWALDFRDFSEGLFFDAGLNGGVDGLFGELQPVLANFGVPGPVTGAGLPGLILAVGGLLGWWRRRKEVVRLKGATS